METIKVAYYQSPAGEMILGGLSGRLCLCDWVTEQRRKVVDARLCRNLKARYENSESDITKEAMRQLDEYFLGKQKCFTIPLLFSGTDFQNRVWSELVKIPYGATISYRELAIRINNPKAIRAVASANAANPMSIFVPCHRVVGADNTLTGYAGGLEAKRMLLSLESQATGRQMITPIS